MKIETVDDLRKLRYGIIGAGALGGFYGSLLCKNGYRTAFLMRSTAKDVKEHGLKINSAWGKWEVHPEVFDSPQDMGVCDILIVGLKTISNVSLKEIFKHTVGPQTIVITLQNGFGNEEYIESMLPDNSATPGISRVIGGCSFICCWRENSTVINHTAGGNIEFAELDGVERPRIKAICQMLNDMKIPCAIKSSPADVRWHKLVWNIPFSGLGLVAKADTAAVLNSPELRATARRIMAEIQMIAKQDGIDITDKFCEWQFERTESMGHYKSSMQIDYECKREAEVEAILGEPVRRARKLGVAVPLMEMIYGAAKLLNCLNIQDAK